MEIGEEGEAIELPIPVCPEIPEPEPAADPEPAEPEKVPA